MKIKLVKFRVYSGNKFIPKTFDQTYYAGKTRTIGIMFLTYFFGISIEPKDW